MGEKIGAEVYLEQAPVKYEGLSYTEIWISEAQERMVLSVSEEQWPALEALCASEDVEATIIGRFVPTGQLTLKYHATVVGELPMEFLHDGRPPVIRKARYAVENEKPLTLPSTIDWGRALINILGSLNVASKEWVIRQYDHEVPGWQRRQTSGRHCQRWPVRCCGCSAGPFVTSRNCSRLWNESPLWRPGYLPYGREWHR